MCFTYPQKFTLWKQRSRVEYYLYTFSRLKNISFYYEIIPLTIYNKYCKKKKFNVRCLCIHVLIQARILLINFQRGWRQNSLYIYRVHVEEMRHYFRCSGVRGHLYYFRAKSCMVSSGQSLWKLSIFGDCRVKRNHEISIEKGILVNIHVQLMHYFEEVFGKMQIIKEFKLCLLVKFI